MKKMPEPNCYDCVKYPDHVISGRSNIQKACARRWVENCPEFLPFEEADMEITYERISTLLINLQAFYNASSGVGHTETLRRGFLSRPEAIVVIACGRDQQQMQHQNCITLHQMAVRPYVDYSRPMVMDNRAIKEMCRDTFNLLNKLQAENSMLKAEANMLRMMKNKEPQ